MKFEKTIFKPKQKLTAAALNRIEDALATVFNIVHQNNEIIISQLFGAFDDYTISSEDIFCDVSTPENENGAFLIGLGIQACINPDNTAIKSDTFDSIVGSVYDNCKYYCKPLVIIDEATEDYTLYLGNFKALYDILIANGDVAGAEMFQNKLTQTGFNLDTYEQLPFVFFLNSDNNCQLANVENGSITECFGRHTFEIVSSISLESRGELQENLIIEELPEPTEIVRVKGLNTKSSLKLAANNSVQLQIKGRPFNLDYTDSYQEPSLPDGSTTSEAYLATAMQCYSDKLVTVTHYFTDINTEHSTSIEDFNVGKLIYRGSRTTEYDLKSLSKQIR